MARLNTKTAPEPVYTAGGALAARITPLQQLERLVLATMLWEDLFYVDGKSTSEFIAEVLPKIKPEDVVALAIKARTEQKLRHIPLFLIRELARRKSLPAGVVRDGLTRVIERPDEIAEFMAIYWKDGKDQPISAQVKAGLAAAFNKFDAYQLAKWDREGDIRLRDVAFLVHAKPKDQNQAKLMAKLVNKTYFPDATKSGFKVREELGLTEFEGLSTADTWEARLSSTQEGSGKKTAEQKKDDWTALLNGNRLGALALIRNLRNMTQAVVDEALIRSALLNVKTERVLPFRFITAAKHNPRLEDALEHAMLKCLEGQEKLPGKTVLIVDVSGSMYAGGNVSSKSELTRVDAAAALAMLVREIAEQPVIYATAGNDYTRKHATKILPPRRGFGLSTVITDRSLHQEIGGGGIFLTQVMDYVKQHEKTADRIIVITDEQDCELDPARSANRADTFGKTNYLINVSAEKNGIGYGKWSHINGWSEAVIDYIRAVEKPAN